MEYLTEKEFKKKLKEAEKIQRQYEMRKQLRDAKRRIPKFKKPSTSKLIVFVVFLICIEILWFSEYMVMRTEDTSFMYSLLGIPATLIPTLVAYYSKAAKENMVGGITYDTAMYQQNQGDMSVVNDDEFEEDTVDNCESDNENVTESLDNLSDIPEEQFSVDVESEEQS